MKEGKRIVFMGTPDFAVRSLEVLLESGIEVAAAVTAPDKPAGRGKKLRASAVKNFAQKQGLKILQPTNLKAPEFHAELDRLNADLYAVVAFRMLPESVWNRPPLGTVNLHASLLPQYRGAAPINWAIINGEQESGVTIFKLQHEIDTGDLLNQSKIPISDTMTAGELHDELMEQGSWVLAETVQALFEGKADPIPQDQIGIPKDQLKPAPKLYKENTRIQWEKSAKAIYNLVRGLNPFPTAWTILENEGEDQKMKVYETAVVEGPEGNPGEIRTDHKAYIKVCTGDGWIELKEFQQAGKKRMAAKDYLNGVQLAPDAHFK